MSDFGSEKSFSSVSESESLPASESHSPPPFHNCNDCTGCPAAYHAHVTAVENLQMFRDFSYLENIDHELPQVDTECDYESGPLDPDVPDYFDTTVTLYCLAWGDGWAWFLEIHQVHPPGGEPGGIRFPPQYRTG